MLSLLKFIEKIIKENTKYLRTYTGKVIELDDSTDSEKSDKLGRVKCKVYELGWTKDDYAVWCYPNDKNCLLSPKVDDFVKVKFMNGDINRPYYTGIITELEDMLPSCYGDHRDQVLFESTDERLYIKYNEEDKEYILEDDDGNKIVINEDGITEDDTNGNKKEWTSNGMKWTDVNNNIMEFTTTGIKWTSAGGKVLELTASEFKMLGATENFIKGLTLCNAFTTLCATIATATSGTTAQNAAGIETIKSAFSVFNGLIANFKSTSIKGE